ncbi:MAG: hypothetical protein M1816_007783 [Peltula sp. TS41687]|nr:MAG: hypothetical protein M1816_007783 [Peltula sp. TS41687]
MSPHPRVFHLGNHADPRNRSELLRKDKSYRRYASGIDRALSLFDTALQEWADYISFLGRLLKALQAHPRNVPTIPFKCVIAKRLAQCLNPSLPSGVHQKALEIYAYVFELIGTDGLSKDLPLYLPGLCPVLSFASLSVRPLFLNLLENHVVRARPFILRPALKAIILALLPGLEDETSEDFQRILGILEKFRSAVKADDSSPARPELGPGGEYFWQCFFLASIASSSRRQGVLAFLTRSLPHLGEAPHSLHLSTRNDTSTDRLVTEKLPENIEAVLFPEPGLLIRSFVTGLSDDQQLVQRGFLDLLVTHLPIHSHVFQDRTSVGDREQLVSAAVGVVTRRDMSLNRRLWAWLLGPDKDDSGGSVPSSPAPVDGNITAGQSSQESNQAVYFRRYGLQPLISSTRKVIGRSMLQPSERARPFRIYLSLMDRWEVGGLVVPEILIPALDNVRRYQTEASTKDEFVEVLRSARVFFDGVESGLICGEVLGLTLSAIKNPQERAEQLNLVQFIFTHFNIREEDMLNMHFPMMVLAILSELGNVNTRSLRATQNSGEIDLAVNTAFSIAELLIGVVPERAYLEHSAAERPNNLHLLKHEVVHRSEKILDAVQTFYKEGRRSMDYSNPPFIGGQLGELLLRESSGLVTKNLEHAGPVSLTEASIKLLIVLLSKLPRDTAQKGPELFFVLHNTLLATSQDGTTPLAFPLLSALVTLMGFIAIHEGPVSGPFLSRNQKSQLLPLLLSQLWAYLSPSHINYHVETVRCIWQIQSAMPYDDRSVEACICALMLEGSTGDPNGASKLGAARKFALLWTHSMQAHGKQAEKGYDGRTDEPGSKRQDSTGKTGYRIILLRPLFHVLDCLFEEGTEEFFWTRNWLQGLPNADRLFQLLAEQLLAFPIFRPPPVGIDSDAAKSRLDPENGDDLEVCIYHIQILANIFRCVTHETWALLAKTTAMEEEQTQIRLLLDCGFTTDSTLLTVFTELCMRSVTLGPPLSSSESSLSLFKLQRTALTVLQQLLENPFSGFLTDLHLEFPLTERLLSSLGEPDRSIQVPLLDAVLSALSLYAAVAPRVSSNSHRRTASKDTQKSPRQSISIDRVETEPIRLAPPPPPQLGNCLLAGFSSQSSRPVLDNWVKFLRLCLPLFSESIFQILIPLVECLCTQVSCAFQDLKSAFDGSPGDDSITPEARIIALFTGLEYCLAYAHDLLMSGRVRNTSLQTPELPQGFFGNMVSGVFNTELAQSKTAAANNRLSVLLSFRDTARVCFEVWSWDRRVSRNAKHELSSLASFTYISTRTRNKARRLLEHLFAAEPLECLENLVEVWCKAIGEGAYDRAETVIDLLHVLDGSKPKNTIPALFNAIYSRTNPNALDAFRKSTLTSDLSDSDLLTFLSEYAGSIDDDAMDEIWTDCLTFLRDVLSNPFPHRQILSRLLEFTATLGEKVDNTSFGDHKMRKDLSDLFVRLLTSTFTIKPLGVSQGEQPQSTLSEKQSEASRPSNRAKSLRISATDDVLVILTSIVPKLPRVLPESERLLGVAYIISTSVIGPAFRSKSFPDSLPVNTLTLLYEVTRLPNTQKFWKKDVAEAFNHPRFFSSAVNVVKQHWLSLIRQWSIGEKDRLPELLLRLTTPSTAGIVFGVGASSARLEADRKTQLNLRRIAFIILASDQDSFVPNIGSLMEKLEELLTATPTSSPSSATKAEIYMVLRALVLRVSSMHLSPLWSVINSELQAALSSVLPGEYSNLLFNVTSVYQACKLLDTLIVISPEEFQLQEWLFITDSIDAVYRPTSNRKSVALVDELSEALDTATATYSTTTLSLVGGNHDVKQRSSSLRKPLLGPQSSITPSSSSSSRQEDLLGTSLKPFFSQLSIHAFESTYAMGAPDWDACVDCLLVDLFDENNIVGG